MTRSNVLWIDDEHDQLQAFYTLSEQKNIILHGHKSFEAGFEDLEVNLDYYDVVLLDGLFFKSKNQHKGTEDLTGIGSALKRLNQLSTKKQFPVFVLSGQDSFTKGENQLLAANGLACYNKSNIKELELLLDHVASAAAKLDEFRLKSKYAELLNVFDPSYIGTSSYSRFVSLLKDIEKQEVEYLTQDSFNAIRKVIEDVFQTLHQLGAIPDLIYNGPGKINKCSRFIANRHNAFGHTSLFHPIYGENLHRILNITQDASHSHTSLQVDEYVQSSNHDYLYRSVIYLLFDILSYTKKFIDDNRDIDLNTQWFSKTSTT